jgi:hypothetical protein
MDGKQINSHDLSVLAFSSKECHDETVMAWRRRRVVVLRGQAFTFGGSSWVEESGLGLMGGSQWILSILSCGFCFSQWILD